jgi:2-oxo-3-hexenedioate decarboxylase
MTPLDLLSHLDSGQSWSSVERAPWPDLASAYAAALAVRDLRIARGEVPRGFKIGFTNRRIWPTYQVFAPIWGTVWDTTLSFCDGDGSVSLSHLCEPRIEPEAVFGFKSSPLPGAGLTVSNRSTGWPRGSSWCSRTAPAGSSARLDTVADSGLHGRLLVGRRVPVLKIAAGARDLQAALAGASVTLQRDGQTVDAGVGGNVLDDPLQALLYFLNELRACPGAPDLRAGDVVTTGTWTDAWPVQAGQRWSGEFTAPLFPLSVAFR